MTLHWTITETATFPPYFIGGKTLSNYTVPLFLSLPLSLPRNVNTFHWKARSCNAIIRFRDLETERRAAFSAIKLKVQDDDIREQQDINIFS